MRRSSLSQFLIGGMMLLGLFCVACISDTVESKPEFKMLEADSLHFFEAAGINKTDPTALLGQTEQRIRSLNRYSGRGKAVFRSFEREELVETQTEFTLEYEKIGKLVLKWIVDDKQFELKALRDQIELSEDGELVKNDPDSMWGLFSVGTKSRGRYKFHLANIFLGSERDSVSIPSFSLLRGVEIIGTDRVNGKECTIIQGWVNEDPDLFTRYYIDRETFMIQRYELIFRSQKRGVITAHLYETYYHDLVE